MDKMVNKISKKAVETYQAASKATEKIAKEIKLKTQMSEKKNKIQELYEDIGKNVYEKYTLKEEININKDLLDICSNIETLADEIENIRMKLLKLKDLKQCPKCHYEIYYDFHYCPNCGAIQEQEEPTETESTEKKNSQKDEHTIDIIIDNEDKDIEYSVED